MAKKHGERNPRMPSVQCPSCGADCLSKCIGKRTLTYWEVYYRCRNDDCDHQFVVAMEAIRTVRPSRLPAPLNSRPLTTWRPTANDRAVNDDSPPDDPAAATMSG